MRPAELAGAKNIRGVFGAAGDLLRPVDHRHIRADVVCRCGFVHGAAPRKELCIWRDALSAERHGKFHRLDDFHVTGAAADIAAERFQDFCIGRIRVFAATARPRP